MIRIKAKIAGFRRSGITHPAEWTEHAEDAFTPDQIRALREEPMLQVQVVKELAGKPEYEEKSDGLVPPPGMGEMAEVAGSSVPISAASAPPPELVAPTIPPDPGCESTPGPDGLPAQPEGEPDPKKPGEPGLAENEKPSGKKAKKKG